MATVSPSCSPRSVEEDNLYQRELEDNYKILKRLGKGTYGEVLLSQCKQTSTVVALKVLPKCNTKLKDFLREFNFSYYLSPHRSVLNTFDVAFETPTAYVFAQEHALCGDLFEAITPQIGLSEEGAKNVIKQISSALEFMHSKGLVHRDIKPENILLFDPKCERVKLMDFGMTKKVNIQVRKVSPGIPYTPPEICEALKGERYSVETAADVWAFAVVIFCTLTGNFPWELAHHMDLFYNEFTGWQRRRTSRMPSQWRKFTPKAMKLFRRLFEPRPEKRCHVREISKFIDDDWIAPPDQRGSTADAVDELSAVLNKHGVNHAVHEAWRKNRLNDWVLRT